MKDNWIDVDRDGMRKVLARRTKHFILTEPIQNALDEPITQLDIDFRVTGRNRCELVVTDDSLKGFEDLADAYTLYKPSKKIGAPPSGGRSIKVAKMFSLLQFLATSRRLPVVSASWKPASV